jgi:hypothetical protein
MGTKSSNSAVAPAFSSPKRRAAVAVSMWPCFDGPDEQIESHTAPRSSAERCSACISPLSYLPCTTGQS